MDKIELCYSRLMRFDSYITAVNGATTADPRMGASPATVPNTHIVNIREHDKDTGRLASRLIIGLEAPAGETVDLQLYLLDSADEDAAPAARHWYLCGTISGLAGGALNQTRLSIAAEAVAGGGLLYVRVTAETISADRQIAIRIASA